jgi:hypothetical protein
MHSLMVVAALMLSLGSANAEDYPTRPINIIVPAAAGGPTDTISRITAQAMSKGLGQQITIENVGGAGGTIGTARVARAEPDGYTLLIHNIGLATSYHLRVINSARLVWATNGSWWSWRWFVDPAEAHSSVARRQCPDPRSFRSICSRGAHRRAAKDARQAVAPGYRPAGRPGERPLEREDFAGRASPRCRARG